MTEKKNDQVNELVLLATLIGEPDKDALATLKAIKPSLDWLSDQALAELEQIPLEKWQMEHTQLFVNGYPTTPALPFESAWMEDQMMGQSTQAIEKLYQQAHYQPEAELPPDFLGSELLFLAFLLENHREEEAFLVAVLQRLHTWVPKFAMGLKIHAELRLYKDYAERLLNLFKIAYDN